MSTQRILPFPCRKSRSLVSRLSSVSGKNSAQNVENDKALKTLSSLSNMQNSNASARSIMQRPRSPRKKCTAQDDSGGGWTSEDILNAIFKLSPCSPIHHMREKLNFDKDKKFKTPLKSSAIKSPIDNHSSNIISPTRTILSPIRALSLNSPGKHDEDQTLDAKRSKVLQLKLSRISHPQNPTPCTAEESLETPSRTRVSRKISAATPSKCKTEAPDTVQKMPARPIGDRRVTRSTRKAHKLRLYENSDEEKENIKPGEESSSPRKKPRPSPEPKSITNPRRALMPSLSPQKAESPWKPRSDFQKFSETVVTDVQSSDGVDVTAEENPPNEIERRPLSPVKRVLQLHRPEGEVYQETKRALHSSVPDYLVGRDEEISKISGFISSSVAERKSGSLYISGPPGTGKSACLMKVLSNDKVTKASSGESKIISVNCMSMRNSAAIYAKIATELGAKPSKCKTARSAMKYLGTALTSDGPTVILLLDEMDQLDSKNQEVLYTIFEWPALKESRLLLIGIANALDLTDRILPRLQARSICKPTLINFRPYTKDQIVAIVEARVKQASHGGSKERVLDPMAVQFCARKVAAVAGDARKALDVCRRAVEVVETSVMSQNVLSPVGKGNGAASAPLRKVGLAQISGVISGVYESSISSRKPASSAVDDREEEAFPLQQKLAVCTLILLSRHTKCKEVTLGKLHESYAKICKKRQVTAVGQSEFVTLLQLIETRGVVSTKSTKQIRMMKISLALQEKDVEYALQDKTLLSAILQEGLPK